MPFSVSLDTYVVHILHTYKIHVYILHMHNILTSLNINAIVVGHKREARNFMETRLVFLVYLYAKKMCLSLRILSQEQYSVIDSITQIYIVSTIAAVPIFPEYSLFLSPSSI